MSLSCEINVTDPSDGIFKPGDSVYGVIKYQIYEPVQYSKITISLKGKGVLDIVRNKSKTKCIENYVDIDEIVQQGDINLAIGTYEALFCFQLPFKIPPSFECSEICRRYKVNCCRIFYYIRIKFEKPLTFQSGKRFKKDITVGLRIKPKLSRQPFKTVKSKNILEVVSGAISTVHIVALIECSVLSPGGKIKLLYTIVNGMDLILNGAVTKLVEVLTFRPYRPLLKTKCYRNVDRTINRSPIIYPRETFHRSVEIVIPDDCKGTLEYSSLVMRGYWVNIVVEMPFPQPDIALKIPVQIGDFGTNTCTVRVDHPIYSTSSSNLGSSTSTPSSDLDTPPSYWEVMGEDNYDLESDNNSASEYN